MSDSDVTTCYRHDHRRAGVICQRCDKPICPDCMIQATVGFHCPECAKSGQQKIIRGPVAFDPIVTKVLIGLNVVAFLGAGVLGGTALGLSRQVLIDWALVAGFVDNGDLYRIFSAAFLHNSPLHLGFNMWALWILGGQLERVFGSSRYLALYGVSLIGGSFGALLVNPNSFTVGASGAVFGLFGATAVVQRSAGVSIWSSQLGPVLAINLLLTFAIPQISVGGHLGGLAVGAAVGAIFVAGIRARKPEWWGLTGAGLVGVGVFLGCLWAAAQWMDPIF